MKEISNREVKEILKEEKVREVLQPAETFWTDFRARARMYPQHAEERAPVRVPWLQLAAGTACAVAVAVWVGVRSLPGKEPVLNQLRSVQVVAPHGSVVVMNHNDTGSLVLWVSDMKADAPGEKQL